jgi:hypothetical protein
MKIDLTEFKLYRWLMRGNWYYYKFGNESLNIKLCCGWLRDPPEKLDMDFCTLLSQENYT